MANKSQTLLEDKEYKIILEYRNTSYLLKVQSKYFSDYYYFNNIKVMYTSDELENTYGVHLIYNKATKVGDFIPVKNLILNIEVVEKIQSLLKSKELENYE